MSDFFSGTPVSSSLGGLAVSTVTMPDTMLIFSGLIYLFWVRKCELEKSLFRENLKEFVIWDAGDEQGVWGDSCQQGAQGGQSARCGVGRLEQPVQGPGQEAGGDADPWRLHLQGC